MGRQQHFAALKRKATGEVVLRHVQRLLEVVRHGVMRWSVCAEERLTLRVTEYVCITVVQDVRAAQYSRGCPVSTGLLHTRKPVCLRAEHQHIIKKNHWNNGAR